MTRVARETRWGGLLVLLTVLAAAAPVASGVSLVTERFGTENGLAGDSVTAMLVDSRGFVWIGTSEGLSRFDGHSFRNYGEAEGLPSSKVTSLLEDGSGSLWVGTSRGLARGKVGISAWVPVPGGPGQASVDALESRDAKSIWAIVDGSVWVIKAGDDTPVWAPAPWSEEIRDARVLGSAPTDTLWIGTAYHGLYRWADGRLDHFSVVPYEEADGVTGVRSMDDGTLWVGTMAGFFIFRPDDGNDPRSLVDRAGKNLVRPGGAWTSPKEPGEVTQLAREAPGRFDMICMSPFVSPDGTIWAVTPDALFRSAEGIWTLVGSESGIDVDALTSGVVDARGNVWLGTFNGGALVVRRQGVLSYSRRDGLSAVRIQQVFESPVGELLVLAAWQLHRLDGDLFDSIPLAPRELRYQGWGWAQVVAFDDAGDAWVASGEGLFRYPSTTRFEDFRARTPRRYTKKDGLGGDDVFRVWASHGEVWAGTFGDIPLARYDRERDAFIPSPPADGLPAQAPTAFARDRSGAVWVGFYEGGVTRIEDGRFSHYDEVDGVPSGFVHALEIDSLGRLWIGTAKGGLCIVDDPGASRFRCRDMTVRDGLSSSSVRALVEGSDGVMWVGTTHGVDRLDPASGAIRHFTRHDGLATNITTAATRDREGRVWFGTVGGLSRLPTQRDESVADVQTLVTAILVNGSPRSESLSGLTTVEPLSFPSDTERVEIHFAAPRMRRAGMVRYAYRIGGLYPGWKTTNQGSVVFERLPYRNFRFEVRAVSDDGTEATTAVVPFGIKVPLWMRWWFIVGVTGLVAGLAYLWYRSHVSHLIAVERMRTQIATDLHDDLGSTLSRISILSDIARMQVDEGNPAARILGDIGENARTLVGALGDSIWAIDPRVDDLRSLVARARHHAVEMFEGEGITSRFDVQEGLDSIHLDPGRRRQIFLILKEALNNIARHSGARRVVVSIQLRERRMIVEIVDDGRGFDPDSVVVHEHGTGGRGMGSMRARAESLGGRLEVASREGQGTTLVFEIPTDR